MKEKKLFLNPNEIAFRKIYIGPLEREEITIIFRPGRRLPGDFRAYSPGQKVMLKIIDKVGADWAEIPPEFAPDFSKSAIIRTVESKRIGELKQDDFFGAPPDVHDIKSLRHNLGIIYNLSDEELNEDFVITRTTFEYE